MEWLLIVIREYRKLKARRLLGLEMDAQAEQRLAALERLLVGPPEPGEPERRHFARIDVEIPATLLIAGKEVPVRIVNLSGGGAELHPAPPLDRGEIAIVCVVEGAGSVLLPAQTVWKDDTAAGVSWVGNPVK